MSIADKKNIYLDYLGLVSMGFVSLGYVVFVRPFAELNLQLPFLDFPIFIGEFLLFFCLFILFLKGNLRYDKKYFWVFCYFAFVITKALWGYAKFGPLAFRDAALFYYPIFIIFAYSFRRKGFLESKFNIFYVILIILLFISRQFNMYWLFTGFILAFILSYSYPHRLIKYLLLVVLFVVTPYKCFFAVSRMMVVSNFVAWTYLIMGLYWILRMRKSIKLVMAALSTVFIFVLLFQFSDKNDLTTLIRADKIITTYKKSDLKFRNLYEKHLRVRRGGGKDARIESDEIRRIQIYNPDSKRNSDQFKGEKLGGVIEAGSIDQRAGSPKQDLFLSPIGGGEFKGYSSEMNHDQLSGSMKDSQINGWQESPEERTPMAQLNTEETEDHEPRLNNDSTFNSQSTLSASHLTEDESSKKDDINLGPRGFEKTAQDSSPARIFNPEGAPSRSLEVGYGNAAFRLVIWRDMLAEMWREKPVFGFSFGKPLRSITLETLNWGSGDWGRDGWIGAHNSFLHMIYRAGIIGLLVIIIYLVILFKMIRRSIHCKSLIGILLCGIIVNCFVSANFLLILELPYTAIPIWILFGLTYAYIGNLKPLAISTE